MLQRCRHLQSDSAYRQRPAALLPSRLLHERTQAMVLVAAGGATREHFRERLSGLKNVQLGILEHRDPVRENTRYRSRALRSSRIFPGQV